MVNSRCLVKSTFSLTVGRFVLLHGSSYCEALGKAVELFPIEFPTIILSLFYNRSLLPAIALSLHVRP